jgi:hypothetical protein
MILGIEWVSYFVTGLSVSTSRFPAALSDTGLAQCSHVMRKLGIFE